MFAVNCSKFSKNSNKSETIIFNDRDSKKDEYVTESFRMSRTQVYIMIPLAIYNLMCILLFGEMSVFAKTEKTELEDVFPFMVLIVLEFLVVFFFFSLDPIEMPLNRAIGSGIAIGALYAIFKYSLRTGFFMEYRMYFLFKMFFLDLAFIFYVFDVSFPLAIVYCVFISLFLTFTFEMLEYIMQKKAYK